MLRHVHGSVRDLGDLDEAALSRQNQLRARVKRGQRRLQTQDDGRWAALFGGLEKHGSKAMRATHAEYMSLVAGVAAEGCRSEEMAAISLFLFEQLTSKFTRAEHLQKQAIEEMLGPISTPSLRKLKKLACALAANMAGRGSTAPLIPAQSAGAKAR